MADPTVSAGFARGLLDLAVAKGADRRTLLQRSGIEAAVLLDQDNRVPFASYVALMRAGKELARDPALALHYGEAINISDVSIVGLIGQASETMMDAHVQLNRYVRLVVDVDEGSGDRFQMRQERGGLWIVDTRHNANEFPELTESAFAQFATSARRITDVPMAKAIHFTHAEPSYRAEYDRIFGTPLVFDSDWNAGLMNPAFFSVRIAALPRYVFGVLTERGDALLKDLEDAKSTRGRVEVLLMPVLHTGNIAMDSIASKLAVSRQTLFRKLKAEGTTFERVLDDLRHKMALHYLSGRKVSVNQTAYLIGFSEPAAFSRAFKRWTGASPRNWLPSITPAASATNS
jgi:AraC-like DNA-binding protein